MQTELPRIKTVLARDKPGVMDRLKKYIKVDPITGCHNWIGGKVNGYGAIRLSIVPRVAKTFYIHRLKYYLANSESFDPSLLVLHKCDNPLCSNPEHLTQGTYQDNMDDCIKKNRTAKGITHSQVKLSEEQVIAIRKLYDTKLYPYRVIAEKFNINEANVRAIGERKNWRHL